MDHSGEMDNGRTGTSKASRPVQFPAPQLWVTILIVVLTWLMSAMFTYGVISTKINYLEQQQKTDEQRLDTMEKRELEVLTHYLTREEYQKYHESLEAKLDLHEQLLQDKLDRMNQLILQHMAAQAKKKD